MRPSEEECYGLLGSMRTYHLDLHGPEGPETWDVTVSSPKADDFDLAGTNGADYVLEIADPQIDRQTTSASTLTRSGPKQKIRYDLRKHTAVTY